MGELHLFRKSLAWSSVHSAQAPAVVRTLENGRVMRAPWPTCGWRRVSTCEHLMGWNMLEFQNYQIHWYVLKTKVTPMDEETKRKIRDMSQADIPINQRRALYNQMDRRMKRGHLKPGLVEKYQKCLGNSKERWNLLREFMIDENMLESQPIGFWSYMWCTYISHCCCFST